MPKNTSPPAKGNLPPSSPRAERAGIHPIDVSSLLEHDEVHADALFCDVEEIKHEHQIFPTSLLVDTD